LQVSDKDRNTGICSTELRDVAIRAIAPSILIPFRVDCNKCGVSMELSWSWPGPAYVSGIDFNNILGISGALHDVDVVAKQVVHKTRTRKTAITNKE
jgi:hypothetical protein